MNTGVYLDYEQDAKQPGIDYVIVIILYYYDSVCFESILVYIQLASADKLGRSTQILADIGANATLNLYTGSAPPSPDYPTTGTLLATLALPSPAGVVTLGVDMAAIAVAGTGGTDGSQTVTGTTGSGTPFQAVVTVAGGSMTDIVSVTSGSYTVAPTNLQSEPVTGGGLTGGALSIVLTATLTFSGINPVNATASGTVGYARIANSAGQGIVDLDCGLSAAAIILNSLQITQGSPVAVNPSTLTEN